MVYSTVGVVLKSLAIAHTWSGFLEGRHQKPEVGCGSSADFQSLRRALIINVYCVQSGGSTNLVSD